METVAFLFLVSRSDVSQTRCCTSDSNEHVYGTRRKILREFNMEQIVHIVDKHRLKMKSISESDLLTSNSTSSFKVYQEKILTFYQS